MWRILFITFLAAHGFVHIAVWATPKPADGKEPPFDAAHSWLLGDARSLAISLAVVSAALFVVAALGVFGHADWWRSGGRGCRRRLDRPHHAVLQPVAPRRLGSERGPDRRHRLVRVAVPDPGGRVKRPGRRST